MANMANIKCNVRTCCKRVKVEVNDGSQISTVRSLKRVIRCDDITDGPPFTVSQSNLSLQVDR